MNSHLSCQYCSHRNPAHESRCAHCGAPLLAELGTAAIESGRAIAGTARAVEKTVTGVRKMVEGVEKTVEGAEKTAEKTEKSGAAIALPELSWKVVVAAIGAMLILAIVVIRSCSVDAPPPIGAVTPVEALPELVRTASSCSRADTGPAVDNCVIDATHPLLAGGIAGGRKLTFTVRVDTPDHTAAVVTGWRTAGGNVIADGSVFIAIGPSATVWYADTRTGLRIETATFANRAGAQTFLFRSGLVR